MTGGFAAAVGASLVAVLLTGCGDRSALDVPSPRLHPSAASPPASLDISCPGLQPRAPWPTSRRCADHAASTPAMGPRAGTHVVWASTALHWAGFPIIAQDGTVLVPANGFLGGTALDAAGLGALDPGGGLLWTLSGAVSSGNADTAIGADGTLYALSTSTLNAFHSDGTMAWSQPYNTTSTCGPVIEWGLDVGPDGTIVVAWSNQCGREPAGLAAFAPDGTPRWNRALPSDLPMTRPTVGADGTIYYIAWIDPAGTSVYLEGMSPAGIIQWKLGPLPDARGAVPNGVAVSGDGTVYAASNAELLAATADGQQVWSLTLPSGISEPAIGPDGTVYVVEWSGVLDAVDPGGRVKWTYDIGASTAGVLDPAIIGGDGTVYVGGKVPLGDYSTDTQGWFTFAVDPPGRLVWKAAVGIPRALAADGTLIAVDDAKGTVTAVAR